MAEESLVARVSRALAAEIGAAAYSNGARSLNTERLARVALGAMLEPTEVMRQACELTVREQSFFNAHVLMAEEAYTAMIVAALHEHDEALTPAAPPVTHNDR